MLFSVTKKKNHMCEVSMALRDNGLLSFIAVGRGEELWCVPVASRPKTKEHSGLEFSTVWLCTSW